MSQLLNTPFPNGGGLSARAIEAERLIRYATLTLYERLFPVPVSRHKSSIYLLKCAVHVLM